VATKFIKKCLIVKTVAVSLYTYIPVFHKSNPNSVFLYPCILASLYTWILPNEPNFIPSYPSVLSEAKNMILQNKPNFPIFDLKTRVWAKNKPNSTFLNPCILASLYSCFSPNEANLQEAGSRQLEAFPLNEANFTLFLVLLPFPLYLFTFQLNDPNCPVNPVKKIFMQNKANLPEAGSRQLEAFLPNEPNSIFMYPCIPASLYSCFPIRSQIALYFAVSRLQ
ncbi:MAG TPA: hypothetical protein PKB02_08390, partial [Anaerohalosphaeraceae bacterium]|nr:hypothetical protein [Anaerohalosphaeraceae bacterium]